MATALKHKARSQRSNSINKYNNYNQFHTHAYRVALQKEQRASMHNRFSPFRGLASVLKKAAGRDV